MFARGCELPDIFDRFWRGQGAAQASSSGIGLVIAAELARAVSMRSPRLLRGPVNPFWCPEALMCHELAIGELRWAV